MKKIYIIIAIIMAIPSFLKADDGKPKYMWMDCEANYSRLSCRDSIEYYVRTIKETGFTAVVVDMKSIMGEVLYSSSIAPYMGWWKNTYRSESFDMLSLIMESCRKNGLKCLASMNVFCGGHNFIQRGIIYREHPQWQSQVWWEGKLIPISEMKWNYNGMLNPANPEVQEYELSILKEFVTKYPGIDGLILDRVRYDDITSDYSELSRNLFEESCGVSMKHFLEDVLEGGKYYKQWLRWRASVIKDFVVKMRGELKNLNPDLNIGFYTGSWYQYYYMVGVNWASEKYDPSKDFPWADKEYRNTGFAEQMDIYMTGLYYSKITKSEIDKEKKLTYWDCVEGAAELSQKITCGAVPVAGSIYVEQYNGDGALLQSAVRQALKSCDGGLMLFDMSHICDRNWWNLLSNAINE